MSTPNTTPDRLSFLSSKSADLKRFFRSTVTSADRHIISQFLLDAEKELKGCQAEINRLRSAIHLLENRRNGLKKTTEKCHSLLLPVHRLPPEILMNIFLFCCETNDLDTPTCVPAALQVVKVCGHWRNVGLSTPSLWSSIRIVLEPWVGKAGSLVDLTEIFMERSKNSPLDLQVEFYSTTEIEPLDRETDEHVLTPAIAALSHNCARWRSMSLRIPKLFGTHQNLFFGIVRGQTLPLLRSLRLYGFGVHDPRNALPDNLPGLFSRCPSLRTTDIGPDRYLGEKLALPWHQIKSLTIQNSLPRPAFSSIALHYRLEELTLLKVGGHSNRGYTGHVVSNIKTMSVLFRSQDDVDTTLVYLTLSGLTTLRLAADLKKLASWGAWEESSSLDMIDRSACSLTSLVIRHIPITDRQLITLLERLPTLSNLQLEEVPGRVPNAMVTGRFLRRLTVDHENSDFQSGSTFLPALTDITLVIREEGLVEQEIFDVVSSRRIPDPIEAKEVGVKCLQSFRITVMSRDIKEDRLSSLDCFRDDGLRLTVAHRRL
ncbi:hypothetical protein V5O48_013618 [Marasmius crinis-equi]|uniref:F-box domain-containing protein n=1 Tax=Marasmius crinis-equi TaxID=585013 RepID=A0ABR3EZL6_9AGAR